MPLGYEECDIHVYIDYPQERQSDKGSFVFATDGTQIDAGSLVDCIIDPVTLSVFGKPLPMTPEWMTNIVGPYYRFGINDFIYTAPATALDYTDQNYKITGNPYLICKSSVDAITSAKVFLGTDVKRNEPLFFSFSKLDKKSSSKDPIVKLFWSNSTNNDKDVQLHFTQDGGCDVYRGYKPLFGTITTSTASTTVTGVNTKFMTQFANGDYIYSIYGQLLGQIASRTTDTQLTLVANATKNFIGSYNKKQPLKVQSYSRTESNYSGGRPTVVTGNPNDQYNDVYIIPCRGNQLLVITSFGLNFCHSFADLDSTFIFPDPPRNIQGYIDPNGNYTRVPIITPDGQFAIEIPDGKVAFQLAKLYFKANWSCESQVIETAVVPPQLPFFYLDGTIAYSNWTNPTEVVGTGTSFLTDLADSDCLFSRYGNGTIFVGVIQSRTTDTLLVLEEPSQYQDSGAKYLSIPRLSGTISFSTGDNIINGTGTAFLTDLEAGDKVYLGDPNFLVGFVDAVLSNSQFTLASPTTFGAGSARFYKNFNEYSPNILNNYQVEPFGELGFDSIPYDFDLNVQIRTSDLDETLLGGDNKKFKMFIYQESAEDSINYGKMFYSTDAVLNTLNQKTSDATVDIITALESLNISRSESGDLNLSFDARTKLLVDLGVVKPEILSNRPVKVTMKPRRLILTGLVSKGASDQLIGTDTLFTEELFVDQEIYLENGLFVGNVYSIESDTALTLYGYTAEEFAAEPFSPYKIFAEFTIFDGYTTAPDINYLQSGPNATTYSDYALLSFSAIDKRQRLNFEYFSTSPNFDSANIQTIVASSILISGEGYNDPNKATLLISPTIQSYQLPINRNNSNGQYNFSINFGDTSGGFIEKIRTDFANNFVFFSRGEWTFKNISQNGYNNYSIFNLLDYNYLPSSTNPAIDNVSMYLSETLAQNDGLIPIYASYKRTIRNLRKTYETPEANRIIIIGMNKSDGSRIQYVSNDDASQNAALSPQNRPNNWLGDVYPFCQINDKYNTFSDAIQAGDEYFKRLTTGREVIEFDSDLLTYYDNYSKSVPSTTVFLSGTISFSTSSPDVTGVGTAFLSNLEVEIGDYLYTSDRHLIGQVASITSDEDLTLVDNPSVTYSNVIYSNKPPEGPTPLSGEIQFFDNSETVTGTLTEFTTELEIGDILYDNTGRVIGLVYSIQDDFELTLNAFATYDSGTSIPFNNYTVYLKEFNYIDIGDIITIFDEDNVASTWQILDWSCDFIREYETPSYSTPTVRNATYRAKKVTLPTKEDFVLNANFIEPAPNQKIIESFQKLLIRVYAFGLNVDYTYTSTLTNEPAGMVFDGIGSDSFGNYYQISFTPDALDANAIYGQEPNPITFTLSDGTNSKTYQFSVRVYPDTL
jgi:hypothetical protein